MKRHFDKTEERILGSSLMNTVVSEMKNTGSLLAQVKDRYPASFDEVKERELAQIRKTYDMYVDFVERPFEWDFFMKIHEQAYAAEEAEIRERRSDVG